MEQKMLEKMKAHAEHGCGIAIPLLAAYDAIEKERGIAGPLEEVGTMRLMNLLEAVLEAVGTAHLDSDAKVGILMEHSDKQSEAIKYLAGVLDQLAPPSRRGGDPRLN